MEVVRDKGLIEELLLKAPPVDYSVKLPEAEFDVLYAMWSTNPPVTTSYLMQKIGHKKGWKAPTLISFLVRLEDRGFIASYKNGKERSYIPLAQKEKYINAVTKEFINQYHDGSFISAMNSFFEGRNLSDSDIDDLLAWLKTHY